MDQLIGLFVGISLNPSSHKFFEEMATLFFFFFEVKIGGVEFISRNIHFQNEINPFLIFYNFFSIMKSISFSSVHPV